MVFFLQFHRCKQHVFIKSIPDSVLHVPIRRDPRLPPPAFVSSSPVCNALSPVSAAGWMLTDLVGLTSCSSHNCCEFLSALACNSASPHLPTLTSFMTPLPGWCSLSPTGKFTIDVPARVEHSVVTYSQYLGQLWVSVLAAVHCRRKLLWPADRTALRCGFGSFSERCPHRFGYFNTWSWVGGVVWGVMQHCWRN